MRVQRNIDRASRSFLSIALDVATGFKAKREQLSSVLIAAVGLKIMSNQYLGQISIFGFNYAPQNWHVCDGSLLPINQYTALYSLLGITYGGNGTSNFAIPDLRGRRPVSMGAGPGLSVYNLGQMGGTETQSLTQTNLPPHTHGAAVQVASQGRTQPSSAQAGYLLAAAASAYVPADGATYTNLGTGNVTVQPNTGGSNPFAIVDPYTTLNFCIALVGIYPPRP